MKKGEIYEGVIRKSRFSKQGNVITDGSESSVKNGMPGQKVRFMIQKKRSGSAEGRLLEVLEKSPLETREPVCSNFFRHVADACIRPCPMRTSSNE